MLIIANFKPLGGPWLEWRLLTGVSSTNSSQGPLHVTNHTQRVVVPYFINHTQRVVVPNVTNHTQRGWFELPIPSEVPSRFGVGPTLFFLIYYINNLPQAVNSKVSLLYSDDTLRYNNVNPTAEGQLFQADINPPFAWSTKWKMSFNIAQCEAIVFNNKNSIARFNTIWGTPLQCGKIRPISMWSCRAT